MFFLRKTLQGSSWRRLATITLVLCVVIAGCAYWFLSWYHLEQKYQRAQAALARHQFVDAKALFQACALAKPDDGEIDWYLARTARRMDLAREANDFLARAARKGLAPELVHLERSLLSFQTNTSRTEEKMLWNLVEQEHPDAATILEALGKGYRARFSLTQALHCFKLIVEQAPDHYPAWILRGQVCEQLNLSAEAVDCYTKALELAPLQDKARERAAKLLLDQNNPRAALAHLERLPAALQDIPPAMLYRIQAQVQLGEMEQARAALARTGLDLRRDALAAYIQGLSLSGEGRDQEAEPWFRTALEIGPGAPRPLHGLLQCLNALGKKKEAAQCLAQLEEIAARGKKIKTLTDDIIAHPDRPEPRCQLGALLLAEKGNEQLGADWLGTVLELDPEHARAKALLAEHYRQRTLKAQPGL